MIKNTEEDIKNKFVLPVLGGMGFEVSDIYFEKSIFLRLGKNVYKVDSDEQIEKGMGRLDILIKGVNGKNLFIIEVKQDEKTINSEDIDQGISYARLVDPIAPFTIITNGKELKIFDSITKEDVSNLLNKEKVIAHKMNLDIQDAYIEALEYFVNYSVENVQIFCKLQVLDNIQPILGSTTDRDKKYIPELYVPIKNLNRQFDLFLNSERAVFAIIGDSGKGKTCFTCGLASEKLAQFPVLFYRGVNLSENLTKTIGEDFNWFFSSSHDDIAILKKIDRIFRDKKILIFIDGIDEWPEKNKVQALSAFVSRIKHRNYKIILSCKTEQWDDFLEVLGTPTDLSAQVFSMDETKGYFLNNTFIEDDEFSSLIRKYRSFYQFEGGFESEALKECRKNLFVLRIMFEVAQSYGKKHISFQIKEFFDEYYNRSIRQRYSNKDEQRLAERTVLAFADILFQIDKENISEDLLRQRLGMGINEHIFPALFLNNILERVITDNGSNIRFYFDKIRDYIISFKLREWDKKPIEELKREFAHLAPGIRNEAIRFFYQFADISRKRIFDEEVRDNAGLFVGLYNLILDKHFHNFKTKFEPYTKREIGIVADFDIVSKQIRHYSFRAIEDSAERIQFIPLSKSFFDRDFANLFYFYGVKSTIKYKAAAKGFTNPDVSRDILESEIIEQLQRIIKCGLLNENGNYYLNLERALAVIFKIYSKMLGLKDHEVQKNLPIAIKDIEYWLNYSRAYSFFEEEARDRLIQNRTGVVSISWTQDEIESVRRKAQEAANEGRQLKSKVRHIGVDELNETLEEAIRVLKRNSQFINEIIIPDTKFIDSSSGEGVYSSEIKKDILSRLYSIFLSEYKILIDTNFGTLKKLFFLHSNLPITLFLINGNGNWYYFFFCKNDDSQNEIHVFDSPTEVDFNEDRSNVVYSNKTYCVLFSGGRNLSLYINPSYTNLNIDSKFTILRELVYERIEYEFQSSLEQIKAILFNRGNV